MVTDIGDKCIDCHESTAWGSGKFVNRIPADNETEAGYLCADCEEDEEDLL